jgi:hypothetical protein
LDARGHRTAFACCFDGSFAWLPVFPDMPTGGLKRYMFKGCSMSRSSVFNTVRSHEHAVLGVPNKLTTGLSRLREAHTIN